MSAAEATNQPGQRLLVVGAGLVGTSVALAARAAGYDVTVDDRDPERVEVACSLGAGRPRAEDPGPWDLAVVAVPPAATGQVLEGLIRSGSTLTISHVSSVQLHPQRYLETSAVALNRFCGGHPVAGSERSGPGFATPELFRDRPWVLCPTDSTRPDAVEAVEALARACGARTTRMSAAAHDELFAHLSHAPQLVASALAAALLGLSRDDAQLAGTGLRDTSRLADSEPELWAEIVAANRRAVAAALRDVVAPLDDLLAALDESSQAAAAATRALVEAGGRGRRLLAGKHGKQPERWDAVDVVVPDQPGTLARLLADTADCGVNVEDIRVEHAAGQPLGVVSLMVRSAGRAALTATLRERGWATTAGPTAAG